MAGAAAAVMVLAGLAAGAPPRVRSVRLYVFDCGVLKRGEPTAYGLTRAQVGQTDFADPCYLVVHPRGTLLWDVGIIPDDQIKAGGVEIQAANGVNAATTTLRSQLAAIGYSARDITYLALSHGHADHVANANEYAGARCCCRRPSGTRCSAPTRRSYRCLPRTAPSKAAGRCCSKAIATCSATDPSILKSTPGHTPGHQSLFVKLAKTGPVLLTGDLYHYAAEKTMKAVPVRDYNREQTAASRSAIDAFVASAGAQLWIQHDIQKNATLKHAPQLTSRAALQGRSRAESPRYI